MSKNPLDLNQLTMEDIDFETLVPKVMAEHKRIEMECREKYGDNWREQYWNRINPPRDYDSDEKYINELIYQGCTPCMSGSPEIIMEIHNKLYAKLKRLFGRSYKKYIIHKANDPKVNKRLIKDALKTGMWKELPEELQEEYHRQAAKKENG